MMQYKPCHVLCQRHPFLLPVAFRSIQLAAASAERTLLQWGHRGSAPFVKRPPQVHGKREDSIWCPISVCNSSSMPCGIFQPSIRQVIPHVSQYPYADSLNPLWISEYRNSLWQFSHLPKGLSDVLLVFFIANDAGSRQKRVAFLSGLTGQVMAFEVGQIPFSSLTYLVEVDSAAIGQL